MSFNGGTGGTTTQAYTCAADHRARASRSSCYGESDMPRARGRERSGAFACQQSRSPTVAATTRAAQFKGRDRCRPAGSADRSGFSERSSGNPEQKNPGGRVHPQLLPAQMLGRAHVSTKVRRGTGGTSTNKPGTDAGREIRERKGPAGGTSTGPSSTLQSQKFQPTVTRPPTQPIMHASPLPPRPKAPPPPPRQPPPSNKPKRQLV